MLEGNGGVARCQVVTQLSAGLRLYKHNYLLVTINSYCKRNYERLADSINELWEIAG